MSSAWIYHPVKEINQSIFQKAKAHQAQLTKPPGSLGRLEDIAIQFCAWQNTLLPEIKNPIIAIFAADHGVADENVSAFPQQVTTEMIRNFSNGGAAISVLANELNINLRVIDMGTVKQLEQNTHAEMVIDKRIAKGTHNFTKQPAMSQQQCQQALHTGAEFLQRAVDNNVDIFIGGDMGIANTTSATALASVLLNRPVCELVGSGSGINNEMLKHKTKIIEQSIELHKHKLKDPVTVLSHLGGFEIAALVGAYISSAQHGIPVIVDGFICTVAALLACKINSEVRAWMCFSHQSTEPGHQYILQSMNVKPLLNFDMRLGEASGAAMVLVNIKLALSLHCNMATFEQANVSDKISP